MIQMDEELAIKVYKFILKEMNGWKQEKLDELPYEEIECDPLFERLVRITAKTDSGEKNKYFILLRKMLLEEVGDESLTRKWADWFMKNLPDGKWYYS